MDTLQVDAFKKEVLTDQGETIQVAVICIQVLKTTTIIDYVRSKEMLESIYDVTIVKETVRELYSTNQKVKKVQLIVLHARKNKAS